MPTGGRRSRPTREACAAAEARPTTRRRRRPRSVQKIRERPCSISLGEASDDDENDQRGNDDRAGGEDRVTARPMRSGSDRGDDAGADAKSPGEASGRLAILGGG